MALMGIPDLPESAFGGDLPPFQRTALVRMMGIKPQGGGGGGGGGGFFKLIAIAAAIAIPFAAPAIASSIGLSAGVAAATGFSAAASSAIGSAMVGAGLGAVNAAVTGGDVGRGALMGGIGGGIGGYNYTPTPVGPPVTAQPLGADFNAYSTTPTAAAPGLSNVPSAIDAQTLSAANATVDPIASLNASQGFTGVDPAYAQIGSAAAFDTSAAATAADVANRAADFGTAAPTAGGPMGPPPPPGSTVVGQSTVVPTSFADAVRAVPSAIAAKFSDPNALADMTLRAAGAIAGSLSAGDGMSDQEKQLLQAQTDELRALQVSNKALFDQKLQAAQDLIGESKYFDPEYFGLQRARKAQLAGAKAKRAGLRGLEGSRRASEERRFDLATGRDTGTAFDQGFGAGVAGRTQTLQAGLTAMPGMQTGYGGDYKNIYDQYAAADRRSTERAKGAGDLFGSITGTSKAKA